MSKKLIGLMTGLVLLVAFVCLPVASAADDDDKPKHSIKDVMKKVMKGKPNLLSKVVESGSEKEKKELHEWLVALSKNKPPKGEADSWKKLTGKLVSSSQDLVDGKEGAGKAVMKAANCKACHGEHKGK